MGAVMLQAIESKRLSTITRNAGELGRVTTGAPIQP
jgi:hypothetical protein